MKLYSKQKLVKVLENNKKWPLIIVGASAADFEPSCVVRGDIKDCEFDMPAWIKDLSKLESKKKYFVLTSMDQISVSLQERFLGLIKNKSAGSYRLPEEVQILIPVQNAEKLSPEIQRLCLKWEDK